MKYVVGYNFAPGLRQDFESFMDNHGFPFWAGHEGVRSIEVFTKLGGSPMFEIHMDIEDFSIFDQISGDEEYHRLQGGVADLMSEPERHFLLLRRKIK